MGGIGDARARTAVRARNLRRVARDVVRQLELPHTKCAVHCVDATGGSRDEQAGLSRVERLLAIPVRPPKQRVLNGQVYLQRRKFHLGFWSIGGLFREVVLGGCRGGTWSVHALDE